jgi:hypothetical protein
MIYPAEGNTEVAFGVRHGQELPRTPKLAKAVIDLACSREYLDPAWICWDASRGQLTMTARLPT